MKKNKKIINRIRIWWYRNFGLPCCTCENERFYFSGNKCSITTNDYVNSLYYNGDKCIFYKRRECTQK